MNSGLEIKTVNKSFAEIRAVRGLSLDVGPGEIIALTGPSGAGKTTTCRLVAGLEKPDTGTVHINGRNIANLTPQMRDVSMMFESYALYPLMSVAENIAFALHAPARKGRYRESDIEKRVEDVLDLTELSSFRDRMPHELSGGQKQRVALCRALAQSPSTYLLDEPIAHLDAKLRHKLRGELRRRLTSSGVPTVWCTPDAMEALSVADRVAVLTEGRLRQLDTLEAIFSRPRHIDVARLIGDPAINLLSGSLRRADGSLAFVNDVITLQLPDKTRQRLESSDVDGKVVLGVRPTDIEIAENGAERAVIGEVYTLEPFGKYAILAMRLGTDIVKAKIFRPLQANTGDIVSIRFREVDYVVFDAATGEAI